MIARRHPETAVVFMSGYAQEAVLRAGSLNGAAFIAKPFDVEELSNVLRATVRGPHEAPPPV
jgi:DNA-binding response OmpR family regulator